MPFTTRPRRVFRLPWTMDDGPWTMDDGGSADGTERRGFFASILHCIGTEDVHRSSWTGCTLPMYRQVLVQSMDRMYLVPYIHDVLYSTPYTYVLYSTYTRSRTIMLRIVPPYHVTYELIR